MSNIVKLYPDGSAENPDNVLEQAIGNYQEVFIIGYNKDGELEVRASTNFTNAQIIFALDHFKYKMHAGHYGLDDDE